MATQYEFFKNIFEQADVAAATYISSTVADVTAAIDPVAQKMLLLYVLLWGIAAYRGLINEYIMDGVFRILKVVLVISIATQVGLYSELIANNFIALPDYLSRLVGGSELTTSSRNTLDKILSDGLITGKVYWEQGSLNPLDADIGPYIMAIFTWLAVLACTTYAGFLMVLSKMALAVLIGLGPLFIIMLMFDTTKKFFETWLAQVVNFALVSALTIGVIKLIFGMLANVAESSKASAIDSASEIGILTIASLIIISVISFLVMLQVMSMASGLAGGIALSTLGAAGAMMSKAKGAVGAANRRTTDRERRDPTTWTGAVRERARQRASAAWANRKKPGDNNSIRRTT